MVLIQDRIKHFNTLAKTTVLLNLRNSLLPWELLKLTQVIKEITFYYELTNTGKL